MEIVVEGGESSASAFGLPSDTPPKVEFPAQIRRDGESVISIGLGRGLAELRNVDAGALASDRRVQADLREEVRASHLYQGARLLEAGQGSRQSLVIRRRQVFQPIQLGILEGFPPGSARVVGGRLSGFPGWEISGRSGGGVG